MDFKIRGTCNEMCPESERKFRIKNSLLSNFECLNGKPCEKLMVKSYHRSAAGQNSCKSNQLRTEESLTNTMDYLINNICDKYEENPKSISNWYDFIWDRTREIRKEITIQQLFSKNIIQIIEKCARFHIYCSYKLCELKPNQFDFKLNEENLLNCMKTLKGMYEDLIIQNSKNDLLKTNYSEFLAYYILLNLEKENLAREISNLSLKIEFTKEIKIAIKIYNAYKFQNYYAFFKFFSKSNLLEACILNRYLNKMRSKAFFLIRKALVIGEAKILIDTNYFEKQLFFYPNELNDFCKLIEQDIVGNKIIFVKSKNINLSIEFKNKKNSYINLIEKKLKISEIINGKFKSFTIDKIEKKIDFFNYTNE